jgi:hypothetical protein
MKGFNSEFTISSLKVWSITTTDGNMGSFWRLGRREGEGNNMGNGK